jgi:hypothetical protein
MAEEEIRTALLELEELLAKAYSRNPDAVFYEQQEGWPHLSKGG